MKNNLFISNIVLLSIFILINNGCKKDNSNNPLLIPVIATSEVQNTTQTTSQCGGIIMNDQGEIIIAKGVCWSTNTKPTINDSVTNQGAGANSFTGTMKNLKPNTTYYVRAYATNKYGTGYGNIMTFTTKNPLLVPLITTSEVRNTTQTTAQCGGIITDDKGEIISVKGICWSTNTKPTINDSVTNEGAGVNSFTSTMKNLKSNTTYYVCAYATNSDGTGYGNTMTFTTPKDLTDIDGNVYQTVTIGTQLWMVGNLKVTKFNDGTPISLVTDDIAWSNLATPGYCFYNNDESTYKKNYGALYNWYAVGTGKLAPVGWHIPSDDEWTVLTDFLGGSNIAGGKLKETGTTDWISPNTGATNETNFTALPGGNRGQNAGTFEEVGRGGFWWTSTDIDGYYSNFRSVGNNQIGVGRSGSLRINGLSVRCIKD